MKIKTLKDLKYAYQTKYTSVGSYPLFILTEDGGCLCNECVRSEYRELVDALKRQDSNGWLPIAIDVNWESLIHCDHCNKQIESAYGVFDDSDDN
jgi:hypothetical protein